MSEIVFFNVPAVGHTNPTLPVVEELIRRGHNVWYYSFDLVKEEIEDTGATYISCDSYMTVPTDDVEEMLVNDLAGLAEMGVDTSLNMKETVYKELDHIDPDVIVYDSLSIWGQLFAKDLQIPYVCSTTTLAMNQQSVKHMSPNLKESFQVISGLPKIQRKMKELEEHGFEVSHVKHLFELIENDNETETIVFTAKEFQPEAESFSNKVTFVGPSFSMPELKPRDNQKPLIYISLGSMLNHQTEFYQRCLKAFENEDSEVIIVVGTDTDIEQFGELPENIQMHEKVDQLEVLRLADVFITHSGMNSINESLYFGVPTVLYPLHSEEEMIAKQVVDLGAGERLEETDVETIRETTFNVLEDERLNENAAALSRLFQRTGGPSLAADKIEKVSWS